MKTLKKITIGILALIALFSAGKAYAVFLPIAPATFETGLAAPLGLTDTSLLLASANLTNGTTLSGFVCLTIDINQPNTEYVCGTASTSPTTILNLRRGIDTLDGTTSVAFLTQSHRRGADVRITNYPLDTLVGRLLSGVVTFDNILSYSGLPTFTGASQIVDKNYVDTIAFSGAGVINATSGARGIVQLATGLQLASSTGICSSGAACVLSADNATSTYNSATAPLKVVVTGNNGKIDSNFISGVSATIATSSTFVTGIPLMNIGKNRFVYGAGTSVLTLPQGVTAFWVTICGGGGGGGGGNGTGVASGGGGGGCSMGLISTTTNLTFYVGAKGTGGGTGSSNPGTDGGNSSVGGVMIANGGKGASGHSNSVDTGFGAGGTASGGDINIPGQSGTPANNSTIPGRGGGCPFGYPGDPGQVSVTGIAGTGYCSGGSGIVTNTTGGGNGTDGFAIVSW